MTADPYQQLVEDLAAEHLALDEVVADLTNDQWAAATPAAGWSVKDQIGHLRYFDGTALLSATDPDAFIAGRDQLFGSLATAEDLDAYTLGFARSARPDELLEAWRRDRTAMIAALAELGAKDRLEWYGPTMSAMSFTTARLMETWAHGQDVADAFEITRQPTDRLRHIAHLGYTTRAFTYVLRGREVPSPPIHVALTAPSGAEWEWGPADAEDHVVGDAVDFCLVVTQRRNPASTGLTVTGPFAAEWLAIAQAFAGSPTLGPPPPG